MRVPQGWHAAVPLGCKGHAPADGGHGAHALHAHDAPEIQERLPRGDRCGACPGGARASRVAPVTYRPPPPTALQKPKVRKASD